jgi:cytochrome oxidase assembly protein ShyY1
VSSFRFLLSRRWVLFTLVVVLLVYATWWLGRWQWHRLESRRHDNAIIRTNLHATPTPVADALAAGRPVSHDQQWLRVTATGTYDTAHMVTLLYQTDAHSQSGVDIVVPFRTDDGSTLVVDRGWLASDNQVDRPVAVPPPPSGDVTITGWVRADGSGTSTRINEDPRVGLTTRSISSASIGQAIGQATYGGFVDLESESPAPATSLGQVEMPELDDGPHFFYALQWWFFGVLAVVGYGYLLYDERRTTLRSSDEAPDEPPAEDVEPLPVPQSAVPDERKDRKAAKLAHKQAVRAAYKAAQEKDAATRTKAFSTRSENHGAGGAGPTGSAP